MTNDSPSQKGIPEPVLEVQNLTVQFRIRGPAFKPKQTLTAVNDLSFAIHPGETVALVGESGSGKSTTARAIVRLVPIASGSVKLRGMDYTTTTGKELRAVRRRVQMVFQDPYSSLVPSSPIGESIAEPLIVHERLRSQALSRRVGDLLQLVGLPLSAQGRYPSEFSGGQRQRIAIARAIALNPDLVVCDEALSALDVSTQNEIINLLEDLQRDAGLSYLFIAHDLSVVEHIAHRVAVMRMGEVVEFGAVRELFDEPRHPYTKALLAASPVPNPKIQRKRRQERETAGGGNSTDCSLMSDRYAEARASPPVTENFARTTDH